MILATDEATLYLQATTTAVWAPVGQTPWTLAHPGREKTSFYGSLELRTGIETVTQVQTMNSEATAEHLQAVLDRYPEAPILLLWDRAPWHGGVAVQQIVADNPRLELLKFPTAAPDLNPQEHVWKAAREATSHNHNVRDLPSLAERFQRHLTEHTFCYSFLEKYNHDTLCAMFK